MVPLVGLIVFLGVYPKPVLDRIQPSVDRLHRPRRGHSSDYQQPPVRPAAAPRATASQ